MFPEHAPCPPRRADALSSGNTAALAFGRAKPRIVPVPVKAGFAISPDLLAWRQAVRASRRHAGVTPPGKETCSGAAVPFPPWKRAIDLAACLVGLPILAACALAMYVLTRCFSPGPVFYRQERIGCRGRRFMIFKFRTMEVGADCSVHQDYCRDLIHTNAPMAKLDSRGDARLIPLAWVLRASGLDELPQLINILRGEMSLVGPRPCLPAEFEHYGEWPRRRCAARPGLTGLWQVSGKNRTTFRQMIGYDLKYVQECSFRLDLKIIFRTLPCLLAQVRDGAQARKPEPVSAPAGPAETRSSAASNLLSRTGVPQGDGSPAA